MKRFTITICTVLFLVASASGQASKSSTKAKKAAPAMPDSATMMKNWMDYMTPGKVHQMMASWDGTWEGEVTMWMDPSAPPSRSNMTAENKMIMGGRYQQSVNTGNFNGMPFEGMSTLAYDNHKKVFISTWVDNMGTGMMVLEGSWNEAKKTLTLKGKMIDPSSGKNMNVRETFRIVDNDQHVMEMFATGPDGKEFKTMEIKYTRKK